MKNEVRRVVLVGTGFVGMSFAYSMVNQGGAEELVLIDVNHEKAEGEAMDLSHGIPFGPENIGLDREEIIDRVDTALEGVAMTEYRSREVSKLSGGQKQRVAIAGVLAMKPEVIVFDESTAMLDPIGRREILAIAKDLNKQGKTIIMITHNMDEAVLADRIMVLQRGEIVLDGTPKEVFADGVARFGLQLPPATATANILKEKGFIFDEVVINEDELVEGICKQLR